MGDRQWHCCGSRRLHAVAATVLSFAAGETSKTVTVTVTGDAVVEGDETVLLRLSVPDGVVVADAQATGTIANDD